MCVLAFLCYCMEVEPSKWSTFHRRSFVGWLWEDNIKMDTKELELEDVNWNYLAQDRNRRRAVGNTVGIFGFHNRWKIF
jgi:hypothetical protein